MKKWNLMMIITAILVLVLTVISFAVADAESAWTCPGCGKTGNTGNYCPRCAQPNPGKNTAASWTCPKCGKTGNRDAYCPNCAAKRPEEIWALAIKDLAINAGPGTKRYFRELGTYRVKGQWVRVYAKSWDTDNDIWWIQCEIPNTDHVIGWTGLKRFDADTFDLDALPVVVFDRKKK